ncbi:hypothetical protein GLP59_15580 [Sulfitobacter sp. M220]|uniref:DUF6285 domain-containing protein n=1 Tax=Sulfitobacter sp. M220 TaxID=2675333 RepID=UPI001F42E611|nr:DUF6285 domain-containing protein [Sulfitobacter sp. M220]MCF7779042.1 hypothetical protein [Sulfitobacter sp. M220]|tara:strand:+ start:370 stop:762 length:393 start_codon:yes stop_codon:yes gene_type:complete
MQDQPSPDAILVAVVAWLRGTAADALPAHARFEAKVAAGAIELVRRQIGAEPSESDEARMLSALVDDAGGLAALTKRLCAQIDSGEADLSTPGLSDLLIATTLNKIDIDQPEFSAAARLRTLAQRRRGMP